MAGAGLRCLAGNDLPAAAKSRLTRQPIIPLLSGAALAGCAAFSFPYQPHVLIGLMLFLPLLDRGWKLPSFSSYRSNLIAIAGLAVVIGGLLVWQPSFWTYTVITLFLAALPEEWFFRAYFMVRLGDGVRANIGASLLFSLLHGLTRDWITAGLVLVPSLFYGWLYQRTRDLLLLTLVHALSNLVYAMFLEKIVATFLGNLR